MSATRSELGSAVDQPFSLRGRVALVTGSSRGLGRAMAMGLGAAGGQGRDQLRQQCEPR